MDAVGVLLAVFRCLEVARSTCSLSRSGWNARLVFLFVQRTGQFANATGTCSPCPLGKYSAAAGAASCTGAVTLKTAGYYWTTGSTTSSGKVCPKGSYCLSGTGAATPCPAGKYINVTTSTALASCKTCTAVGVGVVCPIGGIYATGTKCGPGTYANTTAQACIPYVWR